MIAIRNLSKAAPALTRTALQSRNMSVVSTPARTPVNAAEQILLSVVMVGSWLVIPTWVMVNMKNYRGQD